MWHRHEKNIRNYLSTYIYRHVIWGNVWELTCDESSAWNTILEHRLRASLAGHLWPECSWMKPFSYGTYPRAPRVTCATDRHRHNGREDPLTWSLRSFTVAYGVRYCLTLLNMNAPKYAYDEFIPNWKSLVKSLYSPPVVVTLWVTFGPA